jgi:hypothetical protein
VVQEAAVKAKLGIVDVSSVDVARQENHERFANLAALYPRFASADADGAGTRGVGN